MLNIHVHLFFLQLENDLRKIETSFFNASFYSAMFKVSSKSKAGNKIRTLQSTGNLALSIKQDL